RERLAAPLAKAAPAPAPKAAAAAPEPPVVAVAPRPAAPTARAEVAADAVTAQAAPMAGLSAKASGETRARRVADPLALALAALDANRDATAADAALERADGTLSPRADPMRLWLAELQRTARGRWAAAEAPAGPATPVPGRDGRPLGRVLLGDDAAWWQGADAAWWRAPLAADELQRLRTGLAGWSAPR
ncbi:MAG TPA: hypothetical protein VLI72_05050, partial [Methylibium sp.]|nr:hypothetical protein [Methylibium sp.]